MPLSHLCWSILLVAGMPGAGGGDLPAEGLESRLRGEDPAALAREARRLGDVRRGALVFYQPGLACTKCHLSEGVRPPLGPDLTAPREGMTEAYLVESLLDPSKSIREGYETISIGTDDGRTLTGLLGEERPGEVVLVDPAQDGRRLTIAKARIEERSDRGPSLMPAGLVNVLASRQQFLDLVRYLMEIAEGGTDRARELRPDPSLLAPPPRPELERNIDHAGLIGSLGPEDFRRGEAIYNRVCVNCHGTKDRPGSLPTSLRFASGTFKNGSDPFGMYRTITQGFGQMPAQTWMVPRQKYDVIHYIREAFLKPDNSGRYVRIDRAYLDRLPRGTGRGPEPVEIEPWATMDYGPSLAATYELGDDGSNFAYKGIAIRLDPGPGGISRGRAWVVYDHDTLRLAGAWTGRGFIDWNGINFNGRHQVHPRAAGRVHLANPIGPGWADPRSGSFDDPRFRGRDGRPYGPLPRPWAHLSGTYRFGDRVIMAYTVGQAEVLETPGLETIPERKDDVVFTRTLDIGRSPRDLRLRVAPEGTAVALAGDGGGKARLETGDGYILLHVPEAATPLVAKVLMTARDAAALVEYAKTSPRAESLRSLTRGGPSRWPEVLETRAVVGRDDGPFAVDVLTVPEDNPWLCQMRLSGFDFLPDGRRAAVCTWDGDVWVVEGIDDPAGGQAWRRIASGLFQPLGLKVVDGRIHVGCRDQIVILHDLNGDGETDFYENFNNDHQVTEHFHEFAMGLQTDSDGNFYYAKGARHALPALVPHHGTLLRVGKDGARTEVLAKGFRAPNGVCLNPDGSFFMSDQEGHWNPKNRINLVKPGGFYGNMWGYHDIVDPSDDAMEPPVCWITNDFDRSPAELLRVESKDPGWAPLLGSLLSLSYGNGKVFVVPHEVVGGRTQGGMCALPIPQLPTGVMRGRFHPTDGQLYACGLFAWAGNQTHPGGFYRIRATGKPNHLPIGLGARKHGMVLTFSGALDPESACDPTRYAAKTWSLKRTAEYGSDHHDERPSRITGAALSDDGRSVTLDIPEIRPTWCMEIAYRIRAADGKPVEGVIHNTIHHLRDGSRVDRPR